MPKYIQKTKEGKEIPFKFENKGSEEKYVETCLMIWGSIPCDVKWATSTNIFKNYKL